MDVDAFAATSTHVDMQTLHISISCLCGRFRAHVDADRSALPLPTRFCHCYGCRHASGSLATTTFRWPGNYPDFSSLTRFDFSPRIWTYFCPNCGTYCFWRCHVTPHQLKVPVSLLDAPTGVVDLQCHIWVAGSRDGGLADFLPVSRGRPLPRWADAQIQQPKDLSGLLPLGWRHDTLQISQPSPESSLVSGGSLTSIETMLRAKCLCGGIDFYILRPSQQQPLHAHKGSPDGNGRAAWWLRTGDRWPAAACVCRSCCIATGSPVAPWAWLPTTHVLLPDGSPYRPGFGAMRWYRSSDEAVRSFCAGCGAAAFYAHDARMADGGNGEGEGAGHGLLNLATGLLCAPAGARADDWLLWQTWAVCHAHQGTDPALARDLGAGLAAWGAANHGDAAAALQNEIAWRRLLDKVSTDVLGEPSAV